MCWLFHLANDRLWYLIHSDIHRADVILQLAISLVFWAGWIFRDLVLVTADKLWVGDFLIILYDHDINFGGVDGMLQVTL